MTTRLMQGFPPSRDSQVSLANWRKAPFSKWAFSHVRELVPSADIPNEPDTIDALLAAPAELESLRLEIGDSSIDLPGFLAATDTDGFVILHKGKLAYEYYGAGMSADTPHILMSVSKSVLGLVFGILQGQGVLDETQKVVDIIPEITGTAYAGATLRDLLDMRVGVAFVEDYTATSGPIVEYRKAQNWDPLAPGDEPSDLRSFYGALTARDGEDGSVFHYVSPNTDLLGWVIERATGRRYADVVSEIIWQPLGASRSAYITVDRLGSPRTAGGMCCTTCDLARLGRLFATGGAISGRQVVPKAWLDDIVAHGDAEMWDAGDLASYFVGLPMRYRSKWYVRDGAHPLVFGVGVYGQNLFVDVDRDLVIAKFSSQPDGLSEPTIRATMQAIEQLRAIFDRA